MGAAGHAGATLGRGFRTLLVAAAISSLGDGLYLAALPLCVASITHDPLLVAGATVAAQAPWLLFTLVSGALVDRVDRRRAMVLVDGFRTVVVGLLGVALLGAAVPIWVIYVAGFLLSTAETLFIPATEALLPAVVGRERLPDANARLEATTWVTSSFAGPPLGALLFGVVAGLPLVLDAATFLAAAALVATIPGRFRPPVAALGTSLRSEIGGGLSFLLRHPVLRWTTPMAGLSNFAGSAILAVFVLYVQQLLALGPLGYGLLMSALGIGGLAGALAAGRINRRLGPTTTIRATLLLGAASVAALAIVVHPAVAAVGAAVFGFQTTIWNVTVVSLRQELVPDRLRGRIAGASHLVSWGVQPLGALAGGVVAALFDLRAPFVLAAAATGVAAVLAYARLGPTAIAAGRAALAADTASSTDPA